MVPAKRNHVGGVYDSNFACLRYAEGIVLDRLERPARSRVGRASPDTGVVEDIPAGKARPTSLTTDN